MIFNFESWFMEEFEMAPIGTSQPLNMEEAAVSEKRLMTGDKAGSTHSGAITGDRFDAALEDDDAMTYRRAKFSVDELHRARRFEKSIKLK
jgi:hypothetical protein